jgi:chromosome segregation ATPase
LCALTSTENHISNIENKVGEIFQSLNLLSEVTSSNSEQLIQIKKQLTTVLENASEVKTEISNITNELRTNNEKIECLAREIAELKAVILSEQGKN